MQNWLTILETLSLCHITSQLCDILAAPLVLSLRTRWFIDL